MTAGAALLMTTGARASPRSPPSGRSWTMPDGRPFPAGSRRRPISLLWQARDSSVGSRPGCSSRQSRGIRLARRRTRSTIGCRDRHDNIARLAARAHFTASPSPKPRSNRSAIDRRQPFAHGVIQAGVVTSLKEEHENSASRIFSNDRDCLAPHVHSRRAKGSVRPCRSEMTLDVESVVGGCVS